MGKGYVIIAHSEGHRMIWRCWEGCAIIYPTKERAVTASAVYARDYPQYAPFVIEAFATDIIEALSKEE